MIDQFKSLKRRKSIAGGLKTQLLGVVLLVVGVTAAIVHFPWLWASQRNIDDVVSQVNEQIAQDTSQELERLFSNVHSTHQLIISSIKTKIFDVYIPAERDTFFLNILKTQPGFTFVQFAYPNGDYVGAQRVGIGTDNKSTLKLHFRKWNPQTLVADKFTDVYHEEPEGLKLIGKEKIQEPNWYSPARPWYQDAIKAAGQTAWTVYIYRSTNTPGIDANIILNKDGKFFGIVGVGFELKQISLYLQKQQEKRRAGGVFIVNSKKELIASMDPGEDSPTQITQQNNRDKPKLKLIDNVQNNYLKIANRSISENLNWSQVTSKKQLTYQDPETKQKYFISIAPAGKLDWMIGTVIPESNYLSEINKNNSNLIFVIIFFVIVVAGVAIFLIDKVIAEPIASITRAAVRVAAGDFEVRVPAIATRDLNNEIGVLAYALNKVTKELQTSKDELEEYDRTIESKVDQRTRARFPNLFANEIGILANAFNDMTAELQGSKAQLEEYNRTLEYKVEQRSGEVKAILYNIASGLAMVDPSDRIVQCNPALLKMLDKQRSQVESQPCNAVFSDQIPELIAYSRANPDQMYSAEINISHDGIGKVSVNSICISDRNQPDQTIYLGALILVRDITFEKQVDRMKTDFVSSVSHELRTPLTSVLGFAKLIQKKLDETVFPVIQTDDKKVLRAIKQVDENLDIIVSEGNRLTKLINDVLDIAKMEAGKVDWNMEPIRIEEVIDRAMSATSALFENKGIQAIRDIAADIPTTIADQNRLIQVVINLISNAVKFQDQGAITCQARQERGEIIVRVIDQGIGISLADIPKVFEKFKQVGDTLTNKPQGTGLGLPICKEIVEYHGGLLWAESAIGSGSTFYFTLPIRTEEDESSSLGDLLHRVAYFENCTSSELQSLVASGYLQTFKSTEAICQENDISESFYLVLSGEVEVYSQSRGQHIANLKKGDFFGEIALLMGIPRTATVKAVTPTTVFVIGRSQLKKLMQNHPNLAEQIALKLSERKQTLIDLGILHQDYQNHKQSVVIEWVRSHLASLFGVQFQQI